jgi:TRAP-type C4-dicarboxylate transport system substrate-binding protein
MKITGVRPVPLALVFSLVLAGSCSSPLDKAGGAKPPAVRTLHVLNTRGEEDIRFFQDRLATLSGGTLKLEIENKWERQKPSADADAINALRAGKADLAVVPARAWHEAGVTAFDALIAPLAIDSLALQEKVLASDLPDQMLPAVGQLGLRGIGILPSSMRRPAGITRTFTSPADFTGARIGFFPSAVAEKTLQTLGAIPVSWAAEGTSIDGLDGAETQVTAVPLYIHDMRSVTANVALWPRPNVLVATPHAYDGLSELERGWLRTSIHDAITPTTQSMLNISEELGDLCRNQQFQFVRATSEQLAALRAALHPVDTWMREDADTARYLDRITALRVGVEPNPKEEPSCAGLAHTMPAPGAATPFDGTYRGDFPADCDPSPENCGTFIYVFGHGRFAVTQENGPACTWAYGIYAVTGDTVEWLYSDGGGIAPTNSASKPGEDFFFRWSAYRDRIELTVVPGVVSWGANTRIPLRRLSTGADNSYLSRRCPPPAQALPS